MISGFMQLIKNFCKKFAEKNEQLRRQQCETALAIRQQQATMQQEYLNNVSKQYALFFRSVLDRITYFATATMQCTVLGICNNQVRLHLQVPLRNGALNVMPNSQALAQMISNLLTMECEERRQSLENSIFNLQVTCYSSADVARHNKAVEDSTCYFMSFRISVRNINSFKADIIVDALLDVGLQESFYMPY